MGRALQPGIPTPVTDCPTRAQLLGTTAGGAKQAGAAGQGLIGRQLSPAVSKPSAQSTRTWSWDSRHTSLGSREMCSCQPSDNVSASRDGLFVFHSHADHLRRNPCAQRPQLKPQVFLGVPSWESRQQTQRGGPLTPPQQGNRHII